MSRFIGGLITALALITSTAMIATPAQAAPPPPWTLPEGVVRVAVVQFHVDEATGEVINTGLVSPGRTFFAGFALRNDSDAPVTVTGFTAGFVFTMDRARQGDLPDDYCMQFFEQRNIDHRQYQQAYPQVIQPGETLRLYDKMTYHYVRGPSSNECQNGTIYYGAPTFAETDGPPESPDPVSLAQTPSVDAPTDPAPMPPAKVDTAA